MSALCQKRTRAVQQKSSLIDHPVGALLKLRRHLGAESLGRFDKFEFDWQGTAGPSRRS
jgi:hypothetical protein